MVDTNTNGKNGVGTRKTRVAILSVASNSLLILLKIGVGILIGSVAVISEAIHSAVDLVAALIALFAVRTASQAADERHPYGHGKFENISGTVEGLLIFFAAAWIIYSAVRKLMHPGELETPSWGVLVMLVSAIVNIVVSRRLFKVGRETDSVALQADGWHLRTDVYTSLGVMLGLLVIWVVGRISPEHRRRLDRPGGRDSGGADDHQGGLGPHQGSGPRSSGRESSQGRCRLDPRVRP